MNVHEYLGEARSLKRAGRASDGCSFIGWLLPSKYDVACWAHDFGRSGLIEFSDWMDNEKLFRKALRELGMANWGVNIMLAFTITQGWVREKTGLSAMNFVGFGGFALLVALIFWYDTAHAEVHELTWVAPTEREDNTALAPAEISHFNVLNSVDGVPIIENIIGSAVATTFDFPTGNHKIVMTAVDTDGRESVFSAILTINSATSPKSVSNFQSRRVTQ